MTTDDTRLIDMHVHSNISDGTFSPSQVTELAYKAGLSAYALTDHDTVFGIAEAMSTNLPIEVIPGIELSAGYGHKDIHILGYYIDHTSQKLLKVSEEVIKERDWRNEKMAANLTTAGIDITVDKIRGKDKNSVLTRAHFARYLLSNNYVKNMGEAFEKYLGFTTPYYVERKYLSPEECIQLINDCGGHAVLAHPMQYKLPSRELEALIVRLKNEGLYGIEAIYSTYTNEEQAIVRSLAHRYSLYITGGSDFHGTNKPDIKIGVGMGNLRIPYDLLEPFR